MRYVRLPYVPVLKLCKLTRHDTQCSGNQLNREISHENVVALREVILEDKSIYMVFEYSEHDFLVSASCSVSVCFVLTIRCSK